jgi:hypothetical protein
MGYDFTFSMYHLLCTPEEGVLKVSDRHAFYLPYLTFDSLLCNKKSFLLLPKLLSTFGGLS